MRVVLQRTLSASVSVQGQVVGKIGRGLMLLIGIAQDDQEADVEWMTRHILKLKLFEDEARGEGQTGKAWSKSILDIKGEVLCISQFTLHAVVKGAKPDFHRAMSGPEAKALYDATVNRLRVGLGQESRVEEGIFGAMMDVNVSNPGPVTIVLDSKK